MSQLANLIQPSFAAGELSQNLRARVDLAKYRAGAALMRNFFSLPTGGAATRAGTAVVGRCKATLASGKPRFIRFVFNQLQAYVLEFGHLYMRVIMDGGYVLEPAKTISGITQANPGVFNVNAHGFAVGDWLFASGITGMVSLNSTAGKQYIVATVPDANHVTLTDLDGHAVDTSQLPAFGGAGSLARIFTLATPYQAADLALLKFTQSADTLTLTHTAYTPRNLTRTQHWVWSLTAITFAAAIQPPTAVVAAALNNPGGTTPQTTKYYVVTAVTDQPFEESVASAVASVANASLNQNTGVNNSITFTAPATGPAPDRYRIYASLAIGAGGAAPTVFGFIGETTGASFVDANYAPDFTNTPPKHTNPFAGSINPGCTTYNQGRKVYGGPAAFPQNVYLSQSGNFDNMDVRSPVQDDDAITLSLNAQEVNAIKHLLSLNVLLALTSSGAWMISPGSQSDVLTPSQAVAKAQAYNGCSDVPPLAINYDILYIQARGSKVRDLSFNFYVNLYTGNDISVLASHLFYGFTIEEWAYAEEPFYLVNAVRNDGNILAFTYLKEQDVYAWAHWDTPGNAGGDAFVSVASIPEGAENVVYAVTARTIPGVNNGQPVYMAERFASRNFYTNGVPDVSKAWCVDCGVQYNGAPTKTITGLDHLEGCKVGILADGSVQAARIVEGGQITLDQPCSIVTVGLLYVCQLQTLRLDVGEPTVQGKRKHIARCALIVQDTRGLKIAPMREDAAGNLVVGNLSEFRERSTEPWGSPIALKQGVQGLVLTPQWQTEGAVFIQQDNPLPATVLAVVPSVVVGDDPG